MMRKWRLICPNLQRNWLFSDTLSLHGTWLTVLEMQKIFSISRSALRSIYAKLGKALTVPFFGKLRFLLMLPTNTDVPSLFLSLSHAVPVQLRENETIAVPSEHQHNPLLTPNLFYPGKSAKNHRAVQVSLTAQAESNGLPEVWWTGLLLLVSPAAPGCQTLQNSARTKPRAIRENYSIALVSVAEPAAELTSPATNCRFKEDQRCLILLLAATSQDAEDWMFSSRS